MMALFDWLKANWSVISPFLALILPFFVKLPFIEHSPILEFIISKIIEKLVGPPPASSSDQSAQQAAEMKNPKI